MSVSNRRWLILAVGTFAIGFVLGIGTVIMLTHGPSHFIASGSEWYSYVERERLVASVSKSALTSSPRWMPGNPLPLRPEDAIARAQESLSRLGPTAAAWSFSEITLREETPHQFFYTVTFHPHDPPNMDMAQLVVYFSGDVTVPTKSSGRAP
jgi:hypothetical protein